MIRNPFFRVLLYLVMVIPVGSGVSALAQHSASFELTEHAFNAAGLPPDGALPASATFRITLHSIGNAMVALNFTGASFSLDAGFGAAYPPPGEVLNLLFVGADTLMWNPEKSAGVYNLYRALLSDIEALSFGVCEEQDILTATVVDGDAVPTNDGYFYLITAQNRLAEEGTKGFRSIGDERNNNTPCP